MKHKMIFTRLAVGGLLLLTSIMAVRAQEPATPYAVAMAAYGKKDYAKAAAAFTQAFEKDGYRLSSGQLYDGACIYALQQDYAQAFSLLNYLAKERLYSDLEHISTDRDLEKMHVLQGWTFLLQQVSDNKKTLPARNRVKIKTELLKAKDILEKDAGKLWGEKIWSSDILVLDNDNTIYSLYPFPGGTQTDSFLYSRKVPENTLSQTNSIQSYEGRNYAVVMTSYLSDSSATIIHELFHVLQSGKVKLLGEPVSYLDNYDAREWLRLEYQALKNALKAAQENKPNKVIQAMLEDALSYRKLRQTTYAAFLDKELQIESLEGLANYTGYKLSSVTDKYQRAIREINGREQASTYTRPFPYATGLAYGLLFDHLQLKWKTGPGHIYNFLSIYESLETKIDAGEAQISAANQRNNYAAIHEQELERKQENEKNLAYYTDRLLNKPTLKVTLADPQYTRSFDMNGTLTLGDKGIVYSSIKGVDRSGKNFGNFSTLADKEKLGYSGILGMPGGMSYVFPLPESIDGNKVKGEFYEIELSKGWEVKKVNERGDMEIVKVGEK